MMVKRNISRAPMIKIKIPYPVETFNPTIIQRDVRSAAYRIDKIYRNLVIFGVTNSSNEKLKKARRRLAFFNGLSLEELFLISGSTNNSPQWIQNFSSSLLEVPQFVQNILALL
jgi:hypothetical protein